MLNGEMMCLIAELVPCQWQQLHALHTLPLSCSIPVCNALFQPRLRRHRPLARAGQQLLFDIAGLLSGLRSLIMLDNAPGATPSLLQQVLEPVFELLPDFQGEQLSSMIGYS